MSSSYRNYHSTADGDSHSGSPLIIEAQFTRFFPTYQQSPKNTVFPLFKTLYSYPLYLFLSLAFTPLHAVHFPLHYLYLIKIEA